MKKVNIQAYSAADIEKYWKGELSTAEMHALEKAAMDDPFLADALEGYRNTTGGKDDLVWLRQKLDDRTGAKTKPFGTTGRLPWLRAAAAIIIIGGAAIFAAQFYTAKKEGSIAISTGNVQHDSSSGQREATASPVKDAPVFTDTSKTMTIERSSSTEGLTSNPGIGNAARQTTIDSVSANHDLAVEEKSQVVPSSEEINHPKSAAPQKLEEFRDKETESLTRGQDSKQKRTFQADSKKEGYIMRNSYAGRVVDAQNNPVPFANVMSTRDQVGTYTDISGNFNLVSSDSILDLQIKALGYETKNYRMPPSGTKPEELVMREDAETRKGIVNQNRKIASNRSRTEKGQLEEPEPVVGWANYDTYITNNIQIPENMSRQGAEVELSFQVDKNGQPVNIRVTRSSDCNECDKEAVRLLKEGPKWKRAGKKSQTTVTISVEN